MKIYVLIPAAGSGTRMGKGVDKLLLDIGGKTVIERTLEAFTVFSGTHDVSCVLAAGEGNRDVMEKIAAGYPVVKKVITGGATRTESVGKLVKALSELPDIPSAEDIIFVHDAARCLVSQDVLARCAKACREKDVCVAGVRAKNTIKIVGSDGTVVDTPDRNTLYEVQTPQCFTYEAITEAYGYAEKNGVEATDDTALAELCGRKVSIVEGDYRNIKITTPEDIAVASSLL